MRIGILGCGYLGKQMAIHWKSAGHFISATTRQAERLNELKPLVNDVFLLSQRVSLNLFLEKQEALLISVAPQSRSEYLSTYLHTAQTIALLSPFAIDLRQIIYISSTSVYGEYQGNWVYESTPANPLNEFSQILYETEQVLLGLKIPVCLLRLGEIYGPGREITNRLRRTQGTNLPGTGNQFTNVIHLEDCIRAIDFAFQQPLQGIYNLCNDLHIPRKELYEQLCKEAKLLPAKWNNQGQGLHGGNKKVSNEKIKSKGFIFKHLVNVI